MTLSCAFRSIRQCNALDCAITFLDRAWHNVFKPFMNLHMNLHHYLTRLFKLFTMKMWQISSCSRNYFTIPNFESSKISNYCTTRTVFQKIWKKDPLFESTTTFGPIRKKQICIGYREFGLGKPWSHEKLTSREIFGLWKVKLGLVPLWHREKADDAVLNSYLSRKRG